MTILYAKQHGEGVYELYCSGCFKPLDIVTQKVINWHFRGDIPVFCFDCDPASADEVPLQLYLPYEQYDLFISPDIFRIHTVITRPPEAIGLGGKSQLQARVLALIGRSSACLVRHISTSSKLLKSKDGA